MDKRTIDTYNKMAFEYDEDTSDFWEKFPQTFFDKFIELNPHSHVLNIGSGPGRDGQVLKERGLDVTCLDASDTMVKISSERGLNSILGDFSDMPFTANTFDAVWAYTALLHVPKKVVSKAMKEVVRVLKPQGYLGLGLIEGSSEGYLQKEREKGPRWFSFYTKQEIEKLLRDHGLTVVHFEKWQPRSKTYLNFIARK